MRGGEGLNLSNFVTLQAILDPDTAALSGDARITYFLRMPG